MKRRRTKPADREALIATAYRTLVKHGPLTSLMLSELLNITPRQATDVLHQIHIQGGSDFIDEAPHPAFRGYWLKVWQAKDWQCKQVGHPPLLEQRVTVTDDDMIWMQEQQRRAAEKAAFRNASR